MTTNQKLPAWGWKNSLWILWTFTFVLNWVAFFYIGMRAKRPLWWGAGLIYAVPTVLLLVLDSSGQGDLWGQPWTWDALAVVLLGLVSIVHAFLVRTEYLRLLSIEREKQARKYQSLQELMDDGEPDDIETPKAQVPRTSAPIGAGKSVASRTPSSTDSIRITATASTSADTETLANQTESSTETNLSQATALTPETNQPNAHELPTETNQPHPTELPSETNQPLATEIDTEPTPTPPTTPVRQTASQKIDAFVLDDPIDPLDEAPSNPESKHHPLQIINLNTAPAEEIANIPGLTLIHGMTAVSLRETQGRFTTLEQFVDAIGLKPHVADRIRPYVML